jgi:acid phosphatase
VVSKLLVFVLENHSLDQMRAQLPYTFSLAQRYGYATNYQALTHPSLGNYLAMLGGSTFGVTDDDAPSAHPISGSSVFGQALASGQTAGLYAEGMPTPCATENGGDRYVVKHNPWAYFVDERASCQQYDVSLTPLAADAATGRLPDVGMVIPDLCHDAHDCDAATADAWLRTQLEPLFAEPDWRAGRLAIVVTADEDDHNQDNLVLTTVLHPSLHGVVVDTPLSHLSLARFYDEVLGLPALREAAGTPSMAAAFGLSVAGAA